MEGEVRRGEGRGERMGVGGLKGGRIFVVSRVAVCVCVGGGEGVW